MRWIRWCLFVLPLSALAQDTLSERIVAGVRNNIEHLPNYTCTTVVDRSQRNVQSKVFQPLDRLRLEVALVNNEEMYAWPGSRGFEDKPIYEMVGDGVASTGEFGLFLQTIFLSGAARIQFAETEELSGHKLYRFAYVVPRAISRWEIRLPAFKDTVGFGGSAWFDVRSLDLVRLEIQAREIPVSLPVTSGRIVMDYARVHVGNGDFVLPASLDQSFVSKGIEGRNLTAFSGCHEYGTSSALSFAELPAAVAPAPAKPRVWKVPVDTVIESRLDTQMDSALIARGDQFEATVTKAVRRRGAILVPEGAKIRGRVTGILHGQPPDACIGIVLHPQWIESPGREGAFAAEQIILPFMNPSRVAHDPCPFVPEPGTAVLQFQGIAFRDTAGLPLVWRTSHSAGPQ